MPRLNLKPALSPERKEWPTEQPGDVIELPELSEQQPEMPEVISSQQEGTTSSKQTSNKSQRTSVQFNVLPTPSESREGCPVDVESGSLPPADKNRNTKNILIYVVVDLVLFGAFGGVLVAFYFAVEPTKLGFYCDDESIALSFKADTVTLTVQVIWCAVTPVVTFCLVELLYFLQQRHESSQSDAKAAKLLGNIKIPFIVENVLYSFTNYSVGIFLLVLTLELMKTKVGKLRPHFLDTCKPDWETFVCFQSIITADNKNVSIKAYVQNYECKQKDKWKVLDARKSFPSSHAATIMYCMLFLTLYLQYRIHWSHLRFMNLLLQATFLVSALWCGLTRLTDNRHHWSDILVGFLMGIVFVMVMIYAVWRLPKKCNSPDKKIYIAKRPTTTKVER